jgi:hypothetical protein
MLAFLVLAASVARSDESPAPKPALPTDHTEMKIEGWTVRVDNRLLAEPHSEKGKRAIHLLTARLAAIVVLMNDEPLAKLREVPIQLDLDYGRLTPAQYHPSAGWLRTNGFSPKLAKCVHIPHADGFLNRFEIHRQPWMILHELAHAYHDRVLGFDHAGIRAAHKKFVDSGKYKQVLAGPVGRREHYALTTPQEFFAEMTEAYWGSNDFYPFVSTELKDAEPEIFDLMQEIWGPLPGRPAKKK